MFPVSVIAKRFLTELWNGFGRQKGRFVQAKSFSQHKTKTYYDILQVTEDVSPKDLKAAFYRLSMKLHPDRNMNKADAAEAFRKVSEAYQVLSSPESRQEYDCKVLGKTRVQKQAPGNVIIKTRSPPPTGHSHIYNFDEFYQQHYGAKLRQDIMYRKQYAQYEAKRDQKPENIPISIWFLAIGFLLIAGWINSFETKPERRTTNK
ncbi:dnaJ homolog subfamily C member 30-like [Varroa jacobsoni]|uniref:dnaJ homolog subfamily C member 30-like n=1 Tax=Varroa jacobsoni TaxID=62625 RepID=UPI000BF7C23D|nr:dnaJ homolog subfamily C member 30-like [Varroa jacobsoni]